MPPLPAFAWFCYPWSLFAVPALPPLLCINFRKSLFWDPSPFGAWRNICIGPKSKCPSVVWCPLLWHFFYPLDSEQCGMATSGMMEMMILLLLLLGPLFCIGATIKMKMKMMRFYYPQTYERLSASCMQDFYFFIDDALIQLWSKVTFSLNQLWSAL